MFDWLKKLKPEDPVSHGELLRAMEEQAAVKVSAKKGPQFVCPESGRVLDAVSIRKYTIHLYPDVIPRGTSHDLARQRKGELLKMAEVQERQWGGSAPPGADKGDA